MTEVVVRQKYADFLILAEFFDLMRPGVSTLIRRRRCGWWLEVGRKDRS